MDLPRAHSPLWLKLIGAGPAKDCHTRRASVDASIWPQVAERAHYPLRAPVERSFVALVEVGLNEMVFASVRANLSTGSALDHYLLSRW